MFLLCSIFLCLASLCVVLCGMESTRPYHRPERDEAAELQAILYGLRAALGGWGLGAVLGWLLSPWIGRRIDQWFAQIATQMEQFFTLLRAGALRAERLACGQAGGLGFKFRSGEGLPTRVSEAVMQVSRAVPPRSVPGLRSGCGVLADDVPAVIGGVTLARAGGASGGSALSPSRQGGAFLPCVAFIRVFAEGFRKMGWADAQNGNSIVPVHYRYGFSARFAGQSGGTFCL